MNGGTSNAAPELANAAAVADGGDDGGDVVASGSTTDEDGASDEKMAGEGGEEVLFKDEDRHNGQVSWSTYFLYFKNMGSALFVIGERTTQNKLDCLPS